MSKRSRARAIVLQILYQDDLNPGRRLSLDDAFVAGRLNHDSRLIDFAANLLAGVRKNRTVIDEHLRAAAENWNLNRMAVVDRNVLRIGAYEILFGDTPNAVAVNEAIELVKRYGSGQSFQFVNGILDRLIRVHTQSDNAH